MRELKFRAWYKPEKKMIYNIQNEFEERIELGMDCFSDYLSNDDLIMDVVLNLLGDDFSYYFYDCKENFDKFNKNTLLEGGKHPNVNNFGELWEFSQKYGIGTK